MSLLNNNIPSPMHFKSQNQTGLRGSTEDASELHFAYGILLITVKWIDQTT